MLETLVQTQALLQAQAQIQALLFPRQVLVLQVVPQTPHSPDQAVHTIKDMEEPVVIHSNTHTNNKHNRDNKRHKDKTSTKHNNNNRTATNKEGIIQMQVVVVIRIQQEPVPRHRLIHTNTNNLHHNNHKDPTTIMQQHRDIQHKQVQVEQQAMQVQLPIQDPAVLELLVLNNIRHSNHQLVLEEYMYHHISIRSICQKLESKEVPSKEEAEGE